MAYVVELAKYIEDLRTITNIDSETGNLQGSKKITEFLKERLERAGAQVSLFPNEKGIHLTARFTGQGNLKLLMLAHTDTVFLEEEAVRRPFSVKNNLAYGPGVGDDKASVLLTVYVMQAIKDTGYNQFGEIVIFYNAEEEEGSETADSIIRKLAQSADVCIVMDTARGNWGIVSKRKGKANYHIEVAGKSGHAGNGPQYSASAVRELVNQITLIEGMFEKPQYYAEKLKDDYGQHIPENTVNIGVIGTSNDKVNVIADNAYAIFELRCFKNSELERLDQKIRSLPEQVIVPNTTVTITGGITDLPMEKGEITAKIIALYGKIVQGEFQKQVVEWHAGGVADGNLAAIYTPTIDALGVEIYNEHTADEYADLATAEPRAKALILLIKQLCERWPNI